MASHAFIEVPTGPDSGLTARLLEAAYRSSREAPAYLWLRGLEPGQANRILDPVVSRAGVSFAGVEFVATPDPTVAFDLARTARLRVVADQELDRRLRDLRLTTHSVESGLRWMEESGDPLGAGATATL